MKRYSQSIGGHNFEFSGLGQVLAKASPARSGDDLAGVSATSETERVAAQLVLSEIALLDIIAEPLIPCETDEVSQLIIDQHVPAALTPVAEMSVGQFREFLLEYTTTPEVLRSLAPGITPEIAAATSKLMRNQDLISVARKCQVTTSFRNTIGLPGRLSSRLQPNNATDDPLGIAISVLDGLLFGVGDAVIGINPANDSVSQTVDLLRMLDDIINRFEIPTQSCVLTHVSNTIQAIERGAPVDLVFQSIAGTQAANSSFGVDLNLLREAHQAVRELDRGSVGSNCMYFETGQGSCLSAGADHGLDQQTLEARAYAVAREFDPLLVNSVVGFIGPEYLYDGKQIRRAGLEDHFCGKLMGLPMGCDVCYTNHAEADQNDSDDLLTLLTVAGCTFFMGIPGADDVMLEYQSTSFHDIAYARDVLGSRPAPEFEQWLHEQGLMRRDGRLSQAPSIQSLARMVEP